MKIYRPLSLGEDVQDTHHKELGITVSANGQLYIFDDEGCTTYHLPDNVRLCIEVDRRHVEDELIDDLYQSIEAAGYSVYLEKNTKGAKEKLEDNGLSIIAEGKDLLLVM